MWQITKNKADLWTAVALCSVLWEYLLNGICNSKISWLMRAFLLTLLSVLSFHKLRSLPSILSSASEVANCLQTKKHLWCFSQKSLKRIQPIVSRAENVSLGTSIVLCGLPVVHLQAFPLWGVYWGSYWCWDGDHYTSFPSMTSSGRRTSSKIQAVGSSTPVQLGLHPMWSTNASSTWASSAFRAVPGWATDSCHGSG